MANILTGVRMLCAVALLFCPALSPAFVALYIVAGTTDMLDGPVARMTGTASAFGARFDSVADFAFVAACLVKLVPALGLPAWLCAWMAAIALVKAVNLARGYAMYGRLVAPHTAWNKVAGFALFVLPPALPVIDLGVGGAVACSVATIAAVQEGRMIRTGRVE